MILVRVGGWVAQAMWSRLRRLCGGLPMIIGLISVPLTLSLLANWNWAWQNHTFPGGWEWAGWGVNWFLARIKLSQASWAGAGPELGNKQMFQHKVHMIWSIFGPKSIEVWFGWVECDTCLDTCPYVLETNFGLNLMTKCWDKSTQLYPRVPKITQ